ncbi:MAG: ABC transporter permease subunit [Desulfovibrio sp.]
MSLYPGLDRPKGPLYNKIWIGVFFALTFLGIFTVYIASDSVEYVWRWNRVPQYFYYNQTVEVHAEIAGDIVSVVDSGDDQEITVTGSDGTEMYLLPKGALLLDDGDYVYVGDLLGSYKEWRMGLLLEGLLITLEVSLYAIVLGISLGLLAGLARISDNPCLKWGAITYIEIIRGSPLLVQLFLWYFVLGTLINALLAKAGLGQVDALWFGVISLAIFTGAYTAEIVRAGIQSVRIGQMEAARSLGMTYNQAMIKVVLPQAFKRILPPLAGQFISLVKDSSLLGVISIRELTKATREVVTSSLQPFEFWIVCAVLYLVLTFALSMFVQYLERRAV